MAFSAKPLILALCVLGAVLRAAAADEAAVQLPAEGHETWTSLPPPPADGDGRHAPPLPDYWRIHGAVAASEDFGKSSRDGTLSILEHFFLCSSLSRHFTDLPAVPY